MFGKKKQPPIQGRQRPQVLPERRNSAVFSYHANNRTARVGTGNTGRDLKAQQKEAEKGPAAERRQTKINWLKRAPTIIGVGLLILLLLNSVLLSTQPRIVSIGDSHSTLFLRSEGSYQQAAADLLDDSLLNRTKITINVNTIAQKLQSQFPELAHVTVTLPVFGQHPVVHIQAPTPMLILSSNSGQSYVLDTTGRALLTPAQAPEVSKLSLPVVTDQSGLSVVPGHIVLPSSTVAFISQVAGQMQGAHLSVASLTLPKGTSELDVRLSGVGYYGRYNIRGDGRAEAGTFLAVKRQLDAKRTVPSTYVDVRVDGRAYYK
ncbi:MAG TPA: hypothetical protein VLH38_01260 [Patescibacteria group bacterium]|nr:hypothetical protein [Patescibacteria group bacterium]